MSNLQKYLNVYEFETVLPGSGETVKYKGITTNSIKKLLIYENEDNPLKEEEILDSTIKTAVIDSSFNTDKMYVLDRYYLFIKIREATKGSKYSFEYTCPKCNTNKYETIDIEDLAVDKPESFDDKLNLVNGNIIFTMDYPTRERQKKLFKSIDNSLGNSEKKVELGLADIAAYVTSIETPEGEENVNFKELISFIGDLPQNELDNIREWRENNDFGIRLEHEIKCISCGETKKIPLPLTNFFS